MTASAELHAAADAARHFGQEWTRDGSRLVEESIVKQLRIDTGGDGALSNARGFGSAMVDVRVSSTQARISNGGDATIWAWLEEGTGRHRVSARRGRVLRTPFGFRRSVVVAGMKAKHTWTKGNERGLDAAEQDAIDKFEQMGR